jgi:hypothetical protein
VVGCRGGTGGLLWTFEDTSCSVGRRFGCAFLRPEISLIQKIAPLIVDCSSYVPIKLDQPFLVRIL